MPYRNWVSYRYKQDPQIVAMTNLVSAYQRRDVYEAEKILKSLSSLLLTRQLILESRDNMYSSFEACSYLSFAYSQQIDHIGRSVHCHIYSRCPHFFEDAMDLGDTQVIYTYRGILSSKGEWNYVSRPIKYTPVWYTLVDVSICDAFEVDWCPHIDLSKQIRKGSNVIKWQWPCSPTIGVTISN